ncbi:hypothetical protein ACOME3_000781 [Neoechinorhynchus agilis]
MHQAIERTRSPPFEHFDHSYLFPENQTRNIESCFLTKTENPLNGGLSDSCRIGDITSSELFTGAILLDDRTESFNAFNRLMPVKTDLKALDGRFLYGKGAVTSAFPKEVFETRLKRRGVLRTVFDSIDICKCGYLTRKQVRMFLKDQGSPISGLGHIRFMFRSTKIEFGEFCSIVESVTGVEFTEYGKT